MATYFGMTELLNVLNAAQVIEETPSFKPGELVMVWQDPKLVPPEERRLLPYKAVLRVYGMCKEHSEGEKIHIIYNTQKGIYEKWANVMSISDYAFKYLNPMNPVV